MKRKSLKVVLFLLIFTLTLSPVAVAAEAGVDASDYIDMYSASIAKTGTSSVKVNFYIGGTGKMDEIGATSIYLYESNGSGWNLVNTYTYVQPANTHLMASNTGSHSSSVTYAGTSGKQYYATIYLWAGKNGSGDSRSKTTSAITA